MKCCILLLTGVATLALSGCGGGATPAPAGEWTWISGSSTINQFGNYGAQGTASSSNVPGARTNAETWTDATGNLWLFGGDGNDSVGCEEGTCELNDLWTYSGGEWTWVGGSNLSFQLSVYGTKGTASPSSVPGARWGAASWRDASGKFWLFGGAGFGAAEYETNDLWQYSAGEWTWVSGSDLPSQPGSYGIQGMPDPGNIPGCRDSGMSWTDSAGNLWLFGGENIFTGGGGGLDDLWRYSDGEWTWMTGSETVNQFGSYGIQGVADPGNSPGSRVSAVTWTDKSGGLWLFGGFNAAQLGEGDLNDLWKYSEGKWTWMSGSNMFEQPGTYGTQGISASNNVPGARYGGVSWTDASGNFWLFGGLGLDSGGRWGDLNDLWKYSAGQWAWMGGSNTVPSGSKAAVYGTKGTAAPLNFPGARVNASSWTDAAGNLWLFGGRGYDSTGAWGILNDLWEYNPQ